MPDTTTSESSVRAVLPPIEPFLTAAQLAPLIAVDECTVANWLRQKDGVNAVPFHYVGRKPRFLYSEVRRWIDEQHSKNVKRYGHIGPRRDRKAAKGKLDRAA